MSIKFGEDYSNSIFVDYLGKPLLDVAFNIRMNTAYLSKIGIIVTKFLRPLFERTKHAIIQGEDFVIVIRFIYFFF